MRAFAIHQTDWVHEAVRLSAVRRAVFIEEQGVPAVLEWDAADDAALHLLAVTPDGAPVGCARVLADGQLGRMAVLPDWRGRGIGRALLSAAIAAVRRRGQPVVRLSAQVHAAGFYAAAGFVALGAQYDEAGIPHIAMQKILDPD